MSVYKNRNETISCTKCGKQMGMAEAHSHVCRAEERVKVEYSEPVTYQRVRLPHSYVCTGCGKPSDVQYLHPGGVVRCWDCTFLPKIKPGELAEQLDSLVDGSVGNLVNHDPQPEKESDQMKGDYVPMTEVEKLLGGSQWRDVKLRQVMDLWELCSEFVRENKITNAHQITDSAVKTPEVQALLINLCDIVGWHKEEKP